MIHERGIESYSDIIECVDLYLKLTLDSPLPSCRGVSLLRFFKKSRANKFIRVLCEGDEIIAWIYCDVVTLDHIDYKIFQQIYFVSSKTGIKAFRSIQMLHESMYEFSKTTEALYCTSVGSPLNETNVLARCLEKIGWERRGYMAFRRIDRG